MFPVYHHTMDPISQSQPLQSHPSWAGMPCQIPPSVFVPPPSTGNVSLQHLGDHGGCCLHGSPTGYYYCRPQCPPIQPPPQPFYWGPYPSYPVGNSSYFVPPLHYSVDRSRYDYDKARHQCCGSQNHACSQSADESHKIEEQRPENIGERDSSDLSLLPNHSSPVVWVPNNYFKHHENNKGTETLPGCWNGWFPLDVSSLTGSRQGHDGNSYQEGEDRWAQKRSPFPFIWIPSSDKLKQEGMVKDLKGSSLKPVDDQPSKFKIVPLKLSEDEGDVEQSKSVHDEDKSQVQSDIHVEKGSKTKIIPVKHVEDKSSNQASISEKQDERPVEKKETMCEKQNEGGEADKVPQKKPSSPVRSSKFSPVCLRVDPLPRKKTTTNGTSRSPSPRQHKDMNDHHINEEQSPCKENKEGKENEDVSEKLIPIDSVNNNNQPDQGMPADSFGVPSKEPLIGDTAENGDCLMAMEAGKLDKVGEMKDLRESKSHEAENKPEMEEKEVDGGHAENKQTKNDLSQADAAVAIQSAYRGFQVRRWQLLEKLRKIAKIQEQARNVGRLAQSIEASPKGVDAKQRTLVGETIMNLLLQLDSIQGLHPSVREVRRIVAKELASLNEKLDALGNQIVEEQKPVGVREEVKDTDYNVSEAISLSNTSKQESLEDGVYLPDSVAKDEAELLAARAVDLPSNEEVDHTGSSLNETAPAQDSMLPVQGNNCGDEPPSANEEPDIAVYESDVMNSSLEFESASGEYMSPSPVTDRSLSLDMAPQAKDNGGPSHLSSYGKESNYNNLGVEGIGKGEEETGTERNGSLNEPLRQGEVNEMDGSSTDHQPIDGDRCEKSTTANSLVSPGKGTGKFFAADATSDAGVEIILEMNDSEGKEQGGASVDFETKDSLDIDDQLEIQSLHEGSTVVEAKHAYTEGDHQTPATGTSPSCLAVENQAISSIGRKEDGQSIQEEVSGPQLVFDGDNSGAEENVCSDGIQPLTEDTHIPAAGDTVSELDHFPPAGKGNLNFNSSEDSSSVTVIDATMEGEKDLGEADTKANMVKERELLEENKKLRQMLESLLEAGKEHLGALSSLNDRVGDLERKLAKKKRKVRVQRNKHEKACS